MSNKRQESQGTKDTDVISNINCRKTMTDLNKISFGVCIGSLLCMMTILPQHGNSTEVFYMLPITIISALNYDS